MVRIIESCQYDGTWSSGFHGLRWNMDDFIDMQYVEGRRTGTWGMRNFGMGFEDTQATWNVHCAFYLLDFPTHAFVKTHVVTLRYSEDPKAYDTPWQVILQYQREITGGSLDHPECFKVLRPLMPMIDFPIDLFNGDVLALIPVTIEPQTWHHLVWRVHIDREDGFFDLYLDDVKIGEGVGLNTQAIDGVEGANQIWFGCSEGIENPPEFAPEAPAFHDVYVCDGQGAAPFNNVFGDVKVNRYYVDGPGARTEWETDGFPPFFTPGVDPNWEAVNDRSPDLTQSVVGYSDVGAVDLYNFQDPLDFEGSCGIAVVAWGARDFGEPIGTYRVKIRVASDGSIYDGPDKNAPTNFTDDPPEKGTEKIWEVNPVTESMFTLQELIDLQIGVELVAGGVSVTLVFIDIANFIVAAIISNVYTDEAQDLSVFAE